MQPSIVSPDSTTRRAAIQWLERDADEYLDEEHASLRVGLVGSELAGVIQWQLCPGDAWVLSPPLIRSAIEWPHGNRDCASLQSERLALARALTESALDAIPLGSRQFIQCLVDQSNDIACLALPRSGMTFLTEVDFLEFDLTTAKMRSLMAQQPQHDVAASSLADGVIIERFLSLISKSNRESLDCPSIAALRTPEQCWQSHRKAGRFRPELWSVYSSGVEDVGLTLMNGTNGPNRLRLVYLGVAPEWRGCGLGRQLVQSALRQAHVLGMTRVELVVDILNHPARRVYADLGAVSVARRLVFAKW